MNVSNETEAISSAAKVYTGPYGVVLIVTHLFGLFGNGVILTAFFQATSIRGGQTFGQVVGNLAASHLIFNLSSIGRGILVQFNTITMSNSTCVYLMSPALLSSMAGNALILCMGVDRFLSILYPVFYRNLPSRYKSFTICLGWLFGFANLAAVFFSRSSTSMVLSCAIPAALNGIAITIWDISNWTIFALVVAAYMLIYFKIGHRKKTISTNNDQTAAAYEAQIKRNVRLLNSFILVVFIFVGCGLFATIVQILIRRLFTDPTLILNLQLYVALVANLPAACDFYIYYARSATYRQQFNGIFVKNFPFLKGKLAKNQVVKVVNALPKQDRDKGSD